MDGALSSVVGQMRGTRVSETLFFTNKEVICCYVTAMVWQ